VERIDDQAAFILHRAELSSQIQGLVQELGRGEPLASPLRWLRKNIDSSRTTDELKQYEESFTKTTLPMVESRLREKKDTEEQEKRDEETAKRIEAFKKEIERKAAIAKNEEKRREAKRKKDEINKLKESLKPINYYLGRKELKEGEDLVLILQQLYIIQPVEGWAYLRVSDKPVEGQWRRNKWSGKPEYMPPIRDFVDYGVSIQWSKVTNGRLYKWSGEVKFWTSWTNVWPLLRAKKAQISGEIVRLAP